MFTIRNGNVPPVCARIAVTGVGIVSPFGDSCLAFRDGLLSGRSGIAPDASFAAAGCRSTLAARVNGFEPAQWVAPMKLRRMDETGPLALAACQQALNDANYTVTSDGDDRAGVVLGTFSAGGHATSEYLSALFRGGPTSAPALLFNSTVGNAAAGLVGLEFKLRGPNLTISQKEASGLAAIATAYDLLHHGRAEGLLAGGVDAIYDLFYRTHDRFRVRSDATTFGGDVAPFSRTRRGFVLGEGAYAFWLEPADHAQARGARVYAELLGIGASSAAGPLNAWPSRPEPIIRSIRNALDEAALTPDDVDVVYASANASRVLDEVEGCALAQLFKGTRVVVTSIKGAIAESGAAGSAACAAAILCGAVGRVPPVTGLVEPDGVVASLRVAMSAVDAPGPIALINSIGSGGALFTAVVRVAV
jgi:3-oxoacyl-[acyl-carrier-protein] synthase II